jgi:hypothetical protein
VATSSASVQVSSYVDDNTTVTGGSLAVTASALVPITGYSTSGQPIYGHSTYAKAVGSGGGLLMGLQATNAEADNTSTVNAYGGQNLHLPSADVTIAAETTPISSRKGPASPAATTRPARQWRWRRRRLLRTPISASAR